MAGPAGLDVDPPADSDDGAGGDSDSDSDSDSDDGEGSEDTDSGSVSFRAVRALSRIVTRMTVRDVVQMAGTVEHAPTCRRVLRRRESLPKYGDAVASSRQDAQALPCAGLRLVRSLLSPPLSRGP